MAGGVQRVERKLAAIFVADVAGYSRLIHSNEVGTLRTLTAHREIMDGLIAEHRGRIVNTAGDSVLAEFPSAIDAVQCAVAVQDQLRAANESLEEARRLRFRIGVHVGDVVVSGGDLLGDDVNVAARLQSIAEPGGISLSEVAYTQVRKACPLTYTDLGLQHFKNIDEPIRVYAAQAAIAGDLLPGWESPKRLSLPDKPSIAVLPFTNLSADPDHEHLADGIVEEIVAALSRVRSFFVISRSSTFTYKERAVDPRQVGRELGVRYVLEGSVRRSSNRLRIRAQLVEAATGGHVWSERYDGELADIFDLQDRVTEAVVGAIEPTIRLSEIERAKRKRPDSLDAYDCVMRAFPAVWSQEPEVIAEGLRLAEQATSLDPTYALPKALAAWCYAQRVVYMRTAVPGEDKQKAFRLAQDAASLDHNDPLVLTVLSAAYALVGQFDLGLAAVEKALAVDPNSSWAWTRSGYLNVYTLCPDGAIEHFERAIRLSPLDPLHYNAVFGIGAAHFAKGDYNEAAKWVEKALSEKPSAMWAYRLLATAYANAGRLEEARWAASKLRVAYPDVTIAKSFEAVPSIWAMRGYAEGLRLAGIPEE